MISSNDVTIEADKEAAGAIREDHTTKLAFPSSYHQHLRDPRIMLIIMISVPGPKGRERCGSALMD